jgi:cell division protein FtsW
MLQSSAPAALPGLPRWQQRISLVLLAAGGLFLALNAIALTLISPRFSGVWPCLAAWAVCALAGEWVLRRRLAQRDVLLFPLCMIMSGWGLLAIYRLLPAFGARQALWLIIATAGLLLAACWPRLLVILRAYRYSLLLFGILLLLATIGFGSNPSGAPGAPALWLSVGAFFFQPSELLKIVLVVFLASYLSEQAPILRAGIGRLPISPQTAGPMVLMWAMCIVILIWQRDLGTAVLFFIVFMLLLYIASADVRLLLAGAVLITCAAAAAYVLFDVVRLRVDIWWNPWADPDGRAYQIVQSLMTFAAGGVAGEGIAQGFPAYVPVAHSDFIFAALAEEWGLIGVVGLIGLLGTLIARGFTLAASLRGRPFHSLLAAGLAGLIGVQALLIMGGVLKLVPLTGVTLPFFSYGGSSLVMSFIAVGLLLALSSRERDA